MERFPLHREAVCEARFNIKAAARPDPRLRPITVGSSGDHELHGLSLDRITTPEPKHSEKNKHTTGDETLRRSLQKSPR